MDKKSLQLMVAWVGPFWGSATAIVVSISQKESYRGMVKYKATMVVYQI